MASDLTPDEYEPPIDWNVTIEHMLDLWVYPEMERRGIEPVPENVTSSLVILSDDNTPAVVKLKGEFQMLARARPTRAIEQGEPITAADLAEVEAMIPAELEDDAAWIALIKLPDGRVLFAFDFRYNMSKAKALVNRARDYLATAESAAAGGQLGPALDNALSAGELAVMAEMRLHAMSDGRNQRHQTRYRWLDGWSRLGNAPTEQSEALRRLAELRGWARYGESDGPSPSRGEPDALIRATRQAVERIEAQLRRWTDDPPQ